jgi:aspartate/methionine/tyrosine aminotransferase
LTWRQPIEALLDDDVRISHYPDVDWIARYRCAGALQGPPLLLAMGESWAGPDPALVSQLAVAPRWVHGYQLALSGLPEARRRLGAYVRSTQRLDPAKTEVGLVLGGTRAAMCEFGVVAVEATLRSSGRVHRPLIVDLAPGWEYGDTFAPLGFERQAMPLNPRDGFHVNSQAVAGIVRHAHRQGRAPVIVAVNSQHNPCGQVWTEDDIETVVHSTAETGAWVLVDDAYFGLAAEPFRAVSAGAVCERLLGNGRWFGVRSFGKQLRTNGWGAGAAFGPPPVMEAWAQQVRPRTTYGIGGLLHWALASYLDSEAATVWAAKRADLLRGNRTLMVRALEQEMALTIHAGVDVPYVLFRAPTVFRSAGEYCRSLALSTGVILTPASSAVGEILSSWVRCHIDVSACVLEDALERMARFHAGLIEEV